MRRNSMISIVVVCIILFFFIFYKPLIKFDKTPLSEESNDFNEKTLDPVDTDESNIERIDSTRPSEEIQNSLDLDHIDNKEDRVVLKRRSDEFQAGINIQVYGHPNMLRSQKLLNYLQELGINSVAIAYPFFQSDWQADQVMTKDELTPNIAEIKGLILSAHAENFSVMLRPILDEKSISSSGHWRGTIEPKNPEKWFQTYRSLLLKYAKLAQETNVEIFNIGTEFNSLQHDKYKGEWLRIIEEIRQVYKGKLVYSFNWDSLSEIPSIEFVSMLDYVGMDAYFPLDAPDNASIEQLEEAWGKWIIEVKKTSIKKPIIITEVGIIPVEGAYGKPYVWSVPGGKYDPQIQVNYYKATYNVWQSMIKGIYWWGATVNEPDSSNMTYSPIGTPTEEVMKQIFDKSQSEDIEYIKD